MKALPLVCLWSVLLLAGSAAPTSAQSVGGSSTRPRIPLSSQTWFVREHAVRVEASESPRVGLWGAVSGAVIGAGIGYAFGRSSCDAVPPGNCVRNGAVGGFLVGAVLGYGIERLARWR